MANGFDIQGLLGNPNFNQGIGLLAGVLGRPTSVGEAVQPGLALGQAAQRNQLQRERLLQSQRQRQARERLPGLLSDPNADRGEVLGLLSTLAPDALAKGLLASVLPQPQKPTTLQREFEFLTGLGVPQEKELESLKRGTVVNVGDRTLDKPLSTADLGRTRLPDGSSPPFGTTMRQAAKAGATVLTTEQQKALDAAGKLRPLLDRIEDLALGPKDASGKRSGGVFSNIEPGIGNRVESAFSLFISSLDRENPNVAELESLTKGSLSLFVRQLGEVGALSGPDVDRVKTLLPEIKGDFLLPDTREDAIRKLNTLRTILERGEKKLRQIIKSRTAKPKAPAVIDFNDLPG